MLANTAFLVGAALGLAPRIGHLTDALAFDLAHHDFYRAAQHGLDAEFSWPGEDGTIQTLPARRVVEILVDAARTGLAGAGVEPDDFEPLLDVVAARAHTGQTGAHWQRRMLGLAAERHGRPEACRRMLEAYVARSRRDEPVHTWNLEDA
jgi:hypothetical protein